MNLVDIALELDARLGTIPGWQARYVGPPQSVSTPCTVIVFPTTVVYDATYGRGSDRITWPIMVLAGHVSDTEALSRMAHYADGTGASSVKAALEAEGYASCDSVRVVNVDFDVVTWQGTDFQGAVFEVDIFGSGRAPEAE